MLINFSILRFIFNNVDKVPDFIILKVTGFIHGDTVPH
jgi:hypothetical protein